MNMGNENKDAIWPFCKIYCGRAELYFSSVFGLTPSFFKKEKDGFDYSKVLVEKKIHVYDLSKWCN
jgi:hypothetical protein